MAKQIPDLSSMSKNFVSSGDYLLIRDTSLREDKKILITELADALFLLQHNVGSVYITYSEDDDPNLRGGSWQLSSKGRALVGVGDNGVNNYANSAMQFGKDSHVLTEAEMPAHRHSKGHVNFGAGPGPANPNSSWAGILQNSGWGVNMPDYGAGDSAYPQTGSRGGSQAHENRQMSETAYIWRRVA